MPFYMVFYEVDMSNRLLFSIDEIDRELRLFRDKNEVLDFINSDKSEEPKDIIAI